MPAGLLPTGTFAPMQYQQQMGTGGPPPKPASMLGGGLAALGQQYEPMVWSDFFDAQDIINDTMPVYTAGAAGHVLVCLHGAGNSAMTFAALAAKMK